MLRPGEMEVRIDDGGIVLLDARAAVRLLGKRFDTLLGELPRVRINDEACLRKFGGLARFVAHGDPMLDDAAQMRLMNHATDHVEMQRTMRFDDWDGLYARFIWAAGLGIFSLAAGAIGRSEGHPIMNAQNCTELYVASVCHLEVLETMRATPMLCRWAQPNEKIARERAIEVGGYVTNHDARRRCFARARQLIEECKP